MKVLIQIIFIFALLQTSLSSKEININEILKKTYDSKKKAIIYLHRIGCAYCNSMEEFTLDDENVKEYIEKNFTLISINVTLKDTIIYNNKRSGGNCFAKDIGYAFYPSALFLSKDSDIEYASVGYKDETEFLVILKYIHKDLYKRISLEEYKSQIGYQKNLDAEIEDKREYAR